MIPLVILASILGVPVLAVIVMFNRLVSLRYRVRESWSGVDTELKRRYDLIPNLVATVKGYAAHERAVLEAVTEARTRAVASTGRPEQQATDENQLVRALNRLLAVVENYPDLKASQGFLQLQQQLVETEDRIQAARRFYNANVRDLNIACEAFPSNLIAALFSFQRADFFQIEDAAVRQAPRADFSPTT